MARPRTPKDKAKIIGQDVKRRKKFEERAEPVVVDSLGDPPDWITDTKTSKARTAWQTMSREIPWLNSSHRALMEIASSIRGRILAGGELPGVQALNLLRQCLGQMGATPADASKAGGKPQDDSEDPAAKYFT